MRHGLDMDKIAMGLGASRKGKVSAKGGYFGALQLLGAALVIYGVRIVATASIGPGAERKRSPATA